MWDENETASSFVTTNSTSECERRPAAARDGIPSYFSGQAIERARFGMGVEMVWQAVRGAIRERFFATWRKTFSIDDGRHAAVESLRPLLAWRPEDNIRTLGLQPYADLGRPSLGTPTCERDDLIFITARFRSGSTLLWNLFRRVPDCVSYYEPLNERKWFDPASRGDRVDQTHREVDVYWSEYEGLECLKDVWDESWPEHRLYLAADSWEPRLKRYIEILCEQAKGRPVLQFNRVDFRVPWLRAQFPKMKLLHLYRHPRDQWLSVLQDPKSFPAARHMKDFAAFDKFYTRPWAEDLKYQFPFLDERLVEHPYELHYFLWKLSYLYGQRYSHCSISFEELSLKPEKALFEMFDVCGISPTQIEPLLGIIKPPPFGKWKDYADDAWFKKYESKCEDVLSDFFGAETRSSKQSWLAESVLA